MRHVGSIYSNSHVPTLLVDQEPINGDSPTTRQTTTCVHRSVPGCAMIPSVVWATKRSLRAASFASRALLLKATKGAGTVVEARWQKRMSCSEEVGILSVWHLHPVAFIKRSADVMCGREKQLSINGVVWILEWRAIKGSANPHCLSDLRPVASCVLTMPPRVNRRNHRAEFL